MKLCFLIIPFFLAQVSHAGMAVQWESFDYSEGEDALSGKGGFLANGTNNADIEFLSLTYTDAVGNTLVTKGRSALLDGPDETGTVAHSRVLSLEDVASDTVWLSFVGKQTSGGEMRSFGISLRAEDNALWPRDSNNSKDEIIAVGIPSKDVPGNTSPASQQWRIWDRGTAGPGWNYNISPNSTTEASFLVLKIELNALAPTIPSHGRRERYTLWVNPPLDREPDPAQGFSFDSTDSDFEFWAEINELRIAAVNTTAAGPSPGFQLDDIRIAETAAEVMPYVPFTITNVAISGGGGLDLTWPAMPGHTEVIQWSENLIDWFNYPASQRTNPDSVSLNSTLFNLWETPAISGQRRFLRVRRIP